MSDRQIEIKVTVGPDGSLTGPDGQPFMNDFLSKQFVLSCEVETPDGRTMLLKDLIEETYGVKPQLSPEVFPPEDPPTEKLATDKLGIIPEPSPELFQREDPPIDA